MPATLFPDDSPVAGLVARISALESQLQVLAATQRMPDAPVMSWQSSATSASVFSPTWDYGSAGSDHYEGNDPLGNLTAGYPKLTLNVRATRVSVTFGGRLEGLANVATSRSAGGLLGVKIDGLEGALQAGLNFQNNAAVHDVPQMTTMTWDLTKGVHTFQLGVQWQNTVPAAADLPRLSTSFIIVAPVNIA